MDENEKKSDSSAAEEVFAHCPKHLTEWDITSFSLEYLIFS
jgi:hypothetical protein